MTPRAPSPPLNSSQDLNVTPFGWSQGEVSAQPHVGTPAGTYEEEFGRQGFFGRVSHLYHRHPPTGWTRIEGPLQPRAYRVHELAAEAEEGEPRVFLANSDVRLGMSRVDAPMRVFARNADYDELRFVHAGGGWVETDYGWLEYRLGDYVLIPRGVTARWVPSAPTQALVIESASEFNLPDRGMLGKHAQFDPMLLRVPRLLESPPAAAAVASTRGEYEVRIRREAAYTRVFYPWNPINTAGWKGDLAPWALNVADIRPIVSPRYHLPPSVHTTLVGRGFVVCSFLPRPLESESGAMKVPFYHRNIDFDEVLFYHAGNFFSREGISAGAVTWHPQGIHHGPHPNAARNAEPLTETHEIAVMVDTLRPLQATGAASQVEVSGYAMSWRQDQSR